jgi:glycosyltransferase involved in cell wall biosynthesis
MMQRARAERFGGANAIYTVIVNDDIDLCLEAKARGCRVVHEVMLNPDIGLYLNEEYRRFPDVPRPLSSLEQIEAGRMKDRRKYEIADLILVPSEFVYRSVIRLGAAPEKVAIVPYGIDKTWLNKEPATVPGRILFVGSVGLLKGTHYLAAATRRLASRKIPCEARVIGPFDPCITGLTLFQGPTYVGQVPRSSVQREFLAADVFVLPCLCEGFALVHLEALACGVPVITTPNCGSVVRDGIDGFIVPVRDPFSLAEAIERIITNPPLRATMSRNARARAREFTWQRYEERLVCALSRLPGRKSPQDVELCSTR